jgi:F-type H+-transporting ATPase subunit b
MLATVLVAAATTSTTLPDVQSKNPILPAGNELVWGTVSFLVLFFLMAKFAFPAVQKSMVARTERIRASLDSAERSKAEAQTVLDEYQRQLADAKNEANRIIEEARRTADQLRVDLQAKAEQESQGIVARAQEEIRAERDRVFQELRTQVGEIAVQLAGKVVGQSLDKSAHERLIDEYIDQVASGETGRN